MDAPTDRAAALGRQLVRTHDRLRATLDDLRDAAAGDAAAAPSGADLPAHHDHGLVAGVLQRVADLAAHPASLPGAVGELDGLAAVLDSHFRWEERRLVEALDAARELSAVAW